jgi:hypothetical protein
LIASPSPSSLAVSKPPVRGSNRAIKSNVIVAAPEADKAKKEHRERGRVKTDIYKEYFIAGGVGAFFLLACLVVLGQVTSVGQWPIPAFFDSMLIPNWVLNRVYVHPKELGRTQQESWSKFRYGNLPRTLWICGIPH